MSQAYEKLGAFYLGASMDPETRTKREGLLLYDSKDLVTHAVCVGMTGSGKTGLCVGLLEEAAMDGVPALIIDPKGDLGNLLLTFPDLKPADFRPWINEDDARRKDMSLDEYAAAQAGLWRNGLKDWHQDGERIRRLRETADFSIFTPGSDAGRPISILASFAAPPLQVIEDADTMRDRVASTVTSLLGLLGIDADPLRSREHILLSNILDHSWREGRDADLAGLIQSIQNPPFKRVGVLDLDSFYPAKDRFELAMLLNNLLAAPGFGIWMTGEPLDVSSLLYGPDGRPRHSVLSIAHLSEPERMFFVSLLLNQLVGWMRTQSGTTSLRAILYMDEIFGFMPPVSEPPSKRPLLTLLKQARAYGLGVVLATQNPVDLDYKGLSNTGTWFLGRLQTERDKARVLDGLEGAGGGGLDRGEIDDVLSGLGKRQFLLHNVHEEGPVIFQTRWVMSYLRGPLTRDQIKRLTKESTPRAEDRQEAADPVEAPDTAKGPPRKTHSVEGVQPAVDSGVEQVFVRPAFDAATASSYQPGLLGLARVHYVDRRSRKHLQTDELALHLPLSDEMLAMDWRDADALELEERDLSRQPDPAVTSWGELPETATKSRSYTGWKKQLADSLYRSRCLELFHSPIFDVTSTPGESERDFRIRLGDLARERRDQEVEALRKKHASKVATLEERVRKARQRVEKEKEQVSKKRLDTAISFGATLLSAFTGRKKFSLSTLSRATTALKGAGGASGESQDVERAEETVEALTSQLETINAALQADVDALEERFDPLRENLETETIRPRRTDVEVRLFALAWTPR